MDGDFFGHKQMGHSQGGNFHFLILVFGRTRFCAAMLLVWSLLTYSGWVPPLFLPAPDAIVKGAVLLFSEFDLMKDITASVLRVTSGFLLAALIGVPLGVIDGKPEDFRSIF